MCNFNILVYIFENDVCTLRYSSIHYYYHDISVLIKIKDMYVCVYANIYEYVLVRLQYIRIINICIY